MKNGFDFDKFASSASFSEVRSLMFESRRPPSMRSPDGVWLYLSSLDERVAKDDATTMRAHLEVIEMRLLDLKKAHNLNYSKINDYEGDKAELEARISYL
ncbi:hypothetical protein RYA99_00965 [Pseudomonas syringae pv. actinidifoliorum]|nr:hypothetical protein [Pseudomonas syringae pv. actinidifoliorum]MDU8521171.1 hypothetical protein [Pseudomonas syringae pv. actinidifoliorum]MDU8524757.1 hypothetical protein [Pseudomonas syringae pv. actinidifoliorum]